MLKTIKKCWGWGTIVVLFVLLFSSCGGSNAFKPFDDIPDANLEDEYYMNFIERYSRHEYIYSYLVEKYLGETRYTDFLEEPDFKFFEQVYNEWKETYPDKVKVAEDNAAKYIRLLNEMTHSTMPAHFDNMKEKINGYLKYVYLDDVSEKDNYEIYISKEFLDKQPKERVSQYLTEHNIKVTDIKFSDISNFSHRAYPLRVEYEFEIVYYIGDGEVPEKNWKTAPLKIEYFIGRDEKNNYIIRYISDPAKDKGKEKPAEGDIMINDYLESLNNEK